MAKGKIGSGGSKPITGSPFKDAVVPGAKGKGK